MASLLLVFAKHFSAAMSVSWKTLKEFASYTIRIHTNWKSVASSHL